MCGTCTFYRAGLALMTIFICAIVYSFGTLPSAAGLLPPMISMTVHVYWHRRSFTPIVAIEPRGYYTGKWMAESEYMVTPIHQVTSLADYYRLANIQSPTLTIGTTGALGAISGIVYGAAMVPRIKR
jgi:hypothetical protein